ncbi:hypothetical protein N9934_03035 [Desulfosarcina sp.]|nr:hypothetical protein [Desulfosarcina sp.]
MLTLKINPLICRHVSFFENIDRAQTLYEKARRATLCGQSRINHRTIKTLQNHGVAGLFIDPEHVLEDSPSPQSRTSVYQGTALYNAHLPDQSFERIATSLAEGVGICSTSRIQKVNKKTVLRVLAASGTHAKKVRRSFLKNMVVSECQLDEMWSFIGKKEKNLDPVEKLSETLGDAWIWIAFDAVNKIILAYVIGKRTTSQAVELIKKIKKVTRRIPDLFSSDQLYQYANALLQVYGKVVQPSRKPGPGRTPNPKLMAPDDLIYVQVVKHYKQYRVVKITKKVVFGNPKKVEDILAQSSVSHKINTSYVERQNGTIRHIDARCSRKTYRFSKCEKNHVNQFELSMAYYHLCKPHATLTKRFKCPTTPFMAAGLTDHVWSMLEFLTFMPTNQCR